LKSDGGRSIPSSVSSCADVASCPLHEILVAPERNISQTTIILSLPNRTPGWRIAKRSFIQDGDGFRRFSYLQQSLVIENCSSKEVKGWLSVANYFAEKKKIPVLGAASAKKPDAKRCSGFCLRRKAFLAFSFKF